MIASETVRQALQCADPSCVCHKPTGHVHCPAHADSTPSLSVTEKDGKMLVHCFGGCEPTRVIDVLRARNLWPSGNGNGHPKFNIIKTYDYQDSAGKIIYQECRLDPKDFRLRRPDPANPGKWIWNLSGVTRYPYRLPELLKAETAFIVEGPKDADRMVALGFTATTNPGGASKPGEKSKWPPEFNQYFKDKTVVIFPDNDPSGKAHAQNVAQNLDGIAASVKVVELPGLPPKGDVSDWISAGGTRAGLINLMDQAPEWRPQTDPKDKKEELREGKPRTQEIKFVNGRELQSTVFKDPAWIVPGIIPEGLCLLSARPKKGKTWFALDVSVAKSSGGCALGKPDLRLSRGKVLYLCLEDKLRRAQKRLKRIMEGAPFPDEIILAETWPKLDKGGLEALQDFLKEHDDCKMVVIDSFTKIKPTRPKNVDPYDFDMEVGGALQSLAQERQVCILLIYHNRKTESEDPLDDVIGSTGLTGAVDAVLVLRRGRGQADGNLFVTGRDVEEQELALKFHPNEGLWELMGEAAEYAKSQERIEIIKFLREHREQGPKGPKEIADALEKKTNSIKALLWKMVKDNEVKSMGGKYEAI